MYLSYLVILFLTKIIQDYQSCPSTNIYEFPFYFLIGLFSTISIILFGFAVGFLIFYLFTTYKKEKAQKEIEKLYQEKKRVYAALVEKEKAGSPQESYVTFSNLLKTDNY